MNIVGGTGLVFGCGIARIAQTVNFTQNNDKIPASIHIKMTHKMTF